jgi:hypothetical protein
MGIVRTLVAAAALAILPGSAYAQGAVANPGDPWVHKAAGVSFPVELAGFTRTGVFEYSRDGRDASAAYALQRDGKMVTVTLYVYPAMAGVPCAAEFEGVQMGVAQYKGATLVRTGSQPGPAGRGQPVALYAQYQLPAGSLRADLPAVRSDAYLHCPADGVWRVKYRASGTAGFDFGPDVERLLHAVRWPEKLGG